MGSCFSWFATYINSLFLFRKLHDTQVQRQVSVQVPALGNQLLQGLPVQADVLGLTLNISMQARRDTGVVCWRRRVTNTDATEWHGCGYRCDTVYTVFATRDDGAAGAAASLFTAANLFAAASLFAPDSLNSNLSPTPWHHRATPQSPPAPTFSATGANLPPHTTPQGQGAHTHPDPFPRGSLPTAVAITAAITAAIVCLSCL